MQGLFLVRGPFFIYFKFYGALFANSCVAQERPGVFMSAYFTGGIPSEHLLESLAQIAPDLIAMEDHEFRYVYFNEAYRREFKKLWGADLEPGMSMLELMAPWPDEQAKAREIWQRALDGEAYSIRMEFGPSQREANYYDLRFNPVYNKEGDIIGAVHVLSDVTAQVRAEKHRELLIRELNHRVKNTLATVQVIARQSFGNGDTNRAQRDTFEARLANLATAHDLLANTHWEYTSLSQVVKKTLDGTGLDMEKVSLTGPQIIITSEQAVSLAMALHELAMNALKHGAMSEGKGRVDVTWEKEAGEEPTFKLVWRESGGPAVTSPEKTGFGMVMIRKVLEYELQGDVKVEFNPDGLVCTVTAPVGNGKKPDATPA